MKKVIMIIGVLLLSFQLIQANEEKTVVLKSGYNAVQFDANVSVEYLVEKIGFENLIGIQGAGQGSTYKKEYIDVHLDFLNSFTQTEAGTAFWFKVLNDITFTYISENLTQDKIINLGEGWSFVGAMLPLTLEEIQSELGVNNLLVLQGAGQGSTYKKEYRDKGIDFLNSFKKFVVGKGYWIKVDTSASLNFVFDLKNIAKDNSSHDAEIVKNINGKNYRISVYSDETPKNETSNSTIIVYGNINGEGVSITLNNTYPMDSRFEVKIFDMDGTEVRRTEILDYGSTMQFSNLILPDNNPCISLADLKTKIANNEDVTGVNTGCITDMSYLFKDNATFNQDIGGWDVSNVINMYQMFYNASSFNQNINDWNVSNIRNMGSMFYGAIHFNSFLDNWNVSRVTYMSFMFYRAYDFNQNINNWNVSHVTSMSHMFYNASSFNQNVEQWNVVNTIDLEGMFRNARSFNQNISNWDISNVTMMSKIFEGSTLFSVENYDALLNGWSQLLLQNGVKFDAPSTKYSSNATASRQQIIDTFGWTISDAGLLVLNPSDDSDNDGFNNHDEGIAGTDINDANSKPVLPDYNVSLELSQNSVTPLNNNITLSIKVNEIIAHGLNSGDLEISLGTDSRFNLAVENNSNWDINKTNHLYRFKYIANNGKYIPQTLSTIVLHGTFNVPSGSSGSFSIPVSLRTGSGDINSDNNHDSKYFEYKDSETPISIHNGILYKDFGITELAYVENSDWNTTVKEIFGSDYRIADWNDLVAYYDNAEDLLNLFDNLGLTEYKAAASITRSGDATYSSTRYYYVSRHEGNRPSYYLAHENIDNYLLSLGSWTGTRKIMVIKKNMLLSDNDNDGFNNYDEEIAGTDINDANFKPVLPDYNVSLELSQNHVTPSNNAVSMTIKVNELIVHGLNSGNLEISLLKNSGFDLAVENNPNWELNNTNSLYIFKYINDNGKYTPQTLSTIVLKGIFNVPNASRGDFPISVMVRTGSGDINAINNNDSKQFYYDSIVLTTQQVAQAKIEFYAQSNSNAKPTFQDYIDVGVVGVTAENLDAVNTRVSTATQEEVHTLAGLNALVASLDDIKAKIVQRHNFYRNLEFQDSNLTWDETLADHAQQWADYLVANYTASDRASGVSPHASQFNSGHGLLYKGEGENIAWSSNGRGYLTLNPVDISVPNTGTGGSVDAWANEKANYDYVTNSTTDSNLAIGHYTQVLWQKTTKVGCGKASGTDGEHVVCRYYIGGNLTGTKPYCKDYSVAPYYNDATLEFTPSIINNQTFSNTKMIEDRVNCSISEMTSEILSFNDDGTGTFQAFDFFNDGDYVTNFNFNSVLENGILKMSGAVNNYNAVMTLTLIGQDADYYYTEAEWSLDEDTQGFFRRGIFKLAK